MKFRGKLLAVRRAHTPCPDDGVHIAAADGSIRSTHAVSLEDKLIPKGSTAFYVRHGSYGFKVFYGLDSKRRTKTEHVKRILEAMEGAGRDYCPRAHEVVGADLDIRYRGERIRITVPALLVEHVHWPETFEDYMCGYAYQFDDQPEHTVGGFKRFVKRARKALGEQEYKLGNVLYNMRLQRWMLVDMRV